MKTQKQTNPLTLRALEAHEPLYETALASAAASASLHPGDRRATLISLQKILRWGRTACRLGVERYRQRKQLMEMDYRQLKDMGITPEEAEQEARKPIWKD